MGSLYQEHRAGRRWGLAIGIIVVSIAIATVALRMHPMAGIACMSLAATLWIALYLETEKAVGNAVFVSDHMVGVAEQHAAATAALQAQINATPVAEEVPPGPRDGEAAFSASTKAGDFVFHPLQPPVPRDGEATLAAMREFAAAQADLRKRLDAFEPKLAAAVKDFLKRSDLEWMKNEVSHFRTILTRFKPEWLENFEKKLLGLETQFTTFQTSQSHTNRIAGELETRMRAMPREFKDFHRLEERLKALEDAVPIASGAGVVADRLEANERLIGKLADRVIQLENLAGKLDNRTTGLIRLGGPGSAAHRRMEDAHIRATDELVKGLEARDRECLALGSESTTAPTT